MPAVLFLLLLVLTGCLVLAGWCYVVYRVVKAAVRDGVNESQLRDDLAAVIDGQ